MAIDPATWTASGIAGAEAVAIAALIVTRRKHRERGRRLGIAVTYQGRDVLDEQTTTHTRRRPPPDPVTPDE